MVMAVQLCGQVHLIFLPLLLCPLVDLRVHRLLAFVLFLPSRHRHLMLSHHVEAVIRFVETDLLRR
jgi:hypothetical protein